MGDLISRQAAIDAITEMGFQKTSTVKAILCRLEALPSAQPERRYDEWCTDCKEYDQEKHCCPRFNHVIRTTLQDAQPNLQPTCNQLATDCISRKAAIDALTDEYHGMLSDESMKIYEIIRWIDSLPSAQRTGRWIPVSERPPEDLEEVNITFTNLEPEPYYDFIKGKRFTGSAVFYKGEWYWYSSITVDVLKEYGRYESEKIDKGLKIIAWQSLPEPYREAQEWKK